MVASTKSGIIAYITLLKTGLEALLSFLSEHVVDVACVA